MTTSPVRTLFQNAVTVLRSKYEEDPATHLFLNRAGKLTSRQTEKASLIELFQLARSHYQETLKSPVKWESLVKSLASILDKEEHDKATFLFLRLAAPIGFNVHGSDFAEQVNTLSVTHAWITENCMQDLYMEIMRSLKAIEKQIMTESESLTEAFSSYFLYNEALVQKEVLERILSFKPKSAEGELLFLKLKASEGESCIHLPFEKHGLYHPIFFSTKKVAAFSDKAFIESMQVKFHDHSDLVSALDEIKTFCCLLKSFSKLYFLYDHHKKVQELAGSFLHHYILKVKKLAPKETISAHEVLHHQIITASKHPYSDRMYNVLLKSHFENEKKAHEPGYSDLRFFYEIDIAPFEALLAHYDAEHRPFFFSHLDQFASLNGSVKKAALQGRCSEETKGVIRELSQFDPKFTDFLTHFKGPPLGDYLPNLESWRDYISKLLQHIKTTYKAPSLESTSAIRRSAERQVKGLAHELEAPVACGGAGCEVRERESSVDSLGSEVPILEEEGDFAEAFGVFSKTHTASVEEFLAEIFEEKVTLKYAQRVQRWFDDPTDVLAKEPYGSKSPRIKEKMVKIHAFSTFVDHFVNSSYSFKSSWVRADSHKVDDLYKIAGTISYDDVVLRGFFEYTICSVTGMCYHRCFKEVESFLVESEDLEASILFDAEYPTIEEASAYEAKKISSSDGKFVVTRDCLSRLNFADYQSAMTITLYRL